MTALVVGVLGASGGLGTTTVAGHLAWRGPHGVTVLVDAAPTRCGALDVHVGIEHLPGPRWSAFARLRGACDGAAVTAALPRTSRYAVLSGDGTAPPEAVRGSVVRGLAGHAGLVVLDLGSGLPSENPCVALCTVLLVVGGLGVRHLADLDMVAADLHRWVTDADADAHSGSVPGAGLPPVVLLTRGRRRSADLAHDVAVHVDLPLLGHWADDPRVAADLEHGIPPGERSHGLDPIVDDLLAHLGPASRAEVPA